MRHLWQRIRNQKLSNDSPEIPRQNQAVQLFDVWTHVQGETGPNRSRESASGPEAIRMQSVQKTFYYQIAVRITLSDSFWYDSAWASMRNVRAVLRNEILSQNAYENPFQWQTICVQGRKIRQSQCGTKLFIFICIHFPGLRERILLTDRIENARD